MKLLVLLHVVWMSSQSYGLEKTSQSKNISTTTKDPMDLYDDYTMFPMMTFPIVTSCAEGTVINGEGGYIFVECDFEAGNSCQTKMESQSNYMKVSYQCQQSQACKNNAASNFPKCYPGQNGVRICFYCCNSHNDCNDMLEIPKP